ncbi:MAG: DNA integrity scanning protein DisA nucleotide-binding domain protein [Mycoplasma sp.]|nr:DNA integrity scanning protein DisA nucleotide-binding domain protein [Candidatus Hennigella equi]
MLNQTSDNLLWICITLLGVIIIFICLAIIYYFARVAHFSIKRKRDKKSDIFKDRKKRIVNVDEVSMFMTNLATALARLSSSKVGALIVFENKDNLEKYVQLGNKVDSPFFPEFVYSIFFNHESALHDGAMIVRNLRITSLSSYLPVSKRLLPVRYGSRHRAAFGIAERTDALAFVVSETTGIISFMKSHEHITLSNDSMQLANQLVDIFFDHYHPLINARTPMVVQKIKERLN